jgi:hypothetical protein
MGHPVILRCDLKFHPNRNLALIAVSAHLVYRLTEALSPLSGFLSFQASPLFPRAEARLVQPRLTGYACVFQGLPVPFAVVLPSLPYPVRLDLILFASQ